MAGYPQAVENVVPAARTALEQKGWQGEQPVAKFGCTLDTHGAPAFRTDVAQILLASGRRALREVEPKAKLGQDQQLVADERRSPIARRRCRFNGTEQAFERLIDTQIRMPFGQRRRGQRTQ